MKQLTLRGFDQELERRVHQLARREGTSLNRAAMRLLRKGAGLADGHQDADIVGESLDQWIGRWSAADEAALLEAVAVFEDVDRQLWQ